MNAAWEERLLGEVFQLEYGKPLDETHRKQDGLYPVYGANGEKDRADKFYFDKESIIVGRKGSAGEVNLTEPKFWPLDVTYFLKFDDRKYDLHFLFFLLKILDLPSLAKGVKPGINRNEVYSIPARIPPLPEQQRIVAILDKAFDAIATAKSNTEKNLQNARALFESHLQSVFSRRGDDWVQKPLGELCERITKGSSPKWQGIAYVSEPGVLFVTSENVGEYEILIDSPKYVQERFNLKDKKSILKRGDVLTNIVGASIGRTAIFNLDEIANINQAVCLMRCDSKLLYNAYLAYLLNSPLLKQVLHDNEVNTARANLSLTFFSELVVPLPPIVKQKELVNRLDSLRAQTHRLESIYQQKLAALEALKKSLLHQAFNGQL